MEQTGVRPSVFVDNLNFTGETPSCLTRAVDLLEVFCQSWGLQIDWSKTWTWGSNASLQRFWTQHEDLAVHYPSGVPVLDSATELGVARIYRQKPSPAALHAHVEEGIRGCGEYQRRVHLWKTWRNSSNMEYGPSHCMELNLSTCANAEKTETGSKRRGSRSLE